jgi:hypothetical protein
MEDGGGFEAYIKKLQQQELEHPERMIDKENLNKASTRTSP